MMIMLLVMSEYIGWWYIHFLITMYWTRWSLNLCAQYSRVYATLLMLLNLMFIFILVYIFESWNHTYEFIFHVYVTEFCCITIPLMIYTFSYNDVLDQMVLELCAYYSRVYATLLMLLNLMYLCKFIVVYIFELWNLAYDLVFHVYVICVCMTTPLTVYWW